MWKLRVFVAGLLICDREERVHLTSHRNEMDESAEREKERKVLGKIVSEG